MLQIKTLILATILFPILCSAQTVKLIDLHEGMPSSAPYFAAAHSGAEIVLLGLAENRNSSQVWVTDGSTQNTHHVLSLPDTLNDQAGVGSYINKLVVPSSPLSWSSGPFALTKRHAGSGPTADHISVLDLNSADWTNTDQTVGQDQIVSVDCPCLDLAVLGDRLLYSATHPIEGVELFIYDGTTTEMVNIHPTSSSGPSRFVPFNNLLLFAADDGSTGFELWKTDGSVAGTELLADIYPGIAGSNPQNFTLFNGEMYFTAFSQGIGVELWKTDGTTAGTMLVKDINPGAIGSFPANLTDGGDGWLYFGAADGTNGLELYKTDGTEVNTQLVADINPGSLQSDLCCLTAYNDKVYFGASDGQVGRELYVSDGTEAGTALVADINSGSVSSITNTTSWLVNDGMLYFRATESLSGSELWQTDGTQAGTSLVEDIQPGSDGSAPRLLLSQNEVLYFAANHPSAGRELFTINAPADDTTSTTGFGDVSQIADVRIFPNPVTAESSIETDLFAGQPVSLSAFDASGKLVDANKLMMPSKGVVALSAGMKDLPTGNYLLQVTSGNQVRILRFSVAN